MRDTCTGATCNAKVSKFLFKICSGVFRTSANVSHKIDLKKKKKKKKQLGVQRTTISDIGWTKPLKVEQLVGKLLKIWRLSHNRGDLSLTSLSNEASRRMLPGLMMKSLTASALGCGAGSSGAYVNLRIARRTEFLYATKEKEEHPS